jgi:energy-coupling factor transporter transmembrane protein EcfT
VGVLVICVLVFTVLYCLYCDFLYCFVYVYLFLFILSLLVQGQLPASENSTIFSSNNHNNYNKKPIPLFVITGLLSSSSS